MPIVGFRFDKIHVERKETLKGVKIQNNIKVSDVKESNLIIGKDEKAALKAIFSYAVDYGDAASLELVGHVIYFDTDSKIKELLAAWTKDQKLPADVGALIYNFIIIKSTIKAIALEADLDLPLHLELPKVVPKKKE